MPSLHRWVLPMNGRDGIRKETAYSPRGPLHVIFPMNCMPIQPTSNKTEGGSMCRSMVMSGHPGLSPPDGPLTGSAGGYGLAVNTSGSPRSHGVGCRIITEDGLSLLLSDGAGFLPGEVPYTGVRAL